MIKGLKIKEVAYELENIIFLKYILLNSQDFIFICGGNDFLKIKKIYSR